MATISDPNPPATIIEQTGDITTDSVVDVVMTGMTLTPAAGTYAVFLSGSVDHGSAGGSIETSIYSAGARVPASERRFLRGADPVTCSFACHAKVTVNGAQAIEGRWRVAAGIGTMHERTLLISEVMDV